MLVRVVFWLENIRKHSHLPLWWHWSYREPSIPLPSVGGWSWRVCPSPLHVFPSWNWQGAWAVEASSGMLRPSCLVSSWTPTPLCILHPTPFLSALLSALPSSLPHHGLLPWCLMFGVRSDSEAHATLAKFQAFLSSVFSPKQWGHYCLPRWVIIRWVKWNSLTQSKSFQCKNCRISSASYQVLK